MSYFSNLDIEIQEARMTQGKMKEYVFTSEEQRILRAAILHYIIEENKAVAYLRDSECMHMADSVNADVKTATQVLKLL
jgi:hypothetical protein